MIDQEMKEINNLVEDPSKYKIIFLKTGELIEEIGDSLFKERMTKARDGGESILVGKRCPNREICSSPEKQYHYRVVITHGELYMTLETTMATQGPDLLRMLLGGE